MKLLRIYLSSILLLSVQVLGETNRQGAKNAKKRWYRVAKSANWKNIMDVKEVRPDADFVDGYTVFNIKGNNYRLIT